MTLEEKIKEVIKLAQPDTRDRLEQALRNCGFTSPDDPALHAIYVQAILAAQPIRMITDGGAEVATAEDLARLGNGLMDILWSVAWMKWGTIILALAICYVAGVATCAVAVKVWPERIASYVDLPKIAVPVADQRLVELHNLGADLVVKPYGNSTYVYFRRAVQPTSGTHQGITYFLFTP